MAYTAHPTQSTGFLPLLARPFVAIWNGMIALAEASETAHRVERLSALSDAELAARGTDRQTEIRRIFAGRMY